MRLIKSLVILLVVLAVLMLAAPFVGKWYLKHWLEQKGFTPVIKQLSINYLFGQVTIGSASISRGGTELAGVFALEFDVNVPQLVQGQWVFDKVVVDNMHFTAAKSGSEWQLAGLSLNQWFAGKGTHPVTVNRIEAMNTDICTVDREQCLRVESLNLGRVNWQRQAAGWAWSHRAPLLVSKVFLQDRTNSSSVLYLESLNIQQTEMTDSVTIIDSLALKNFQLIENQAQTGGKVITPFQTQIGELAVGNITLQFEPTPTIRVVDLKLVSFRQAMQRHEGGPSTWFKRALQWFPRTTELWQRVDFSKPSGTAFELQNFSLQGGRFTWRDDTVAPPVIENLNQIRFAVDRIDSAATQASSLTFDAKLGDIGAVKFDSKAQFFAGAPLFDVTGFAHGVDVANFAGYTHEIFNQRVKAGVIDVSFNVGATGGQVAGQSVWRITDLATEASNAPMGSSFAKLADHNNSVEFELPIGLAIGDNARPATALGRALANTLSNRARGVPVKSTQAPPSQLALDTLPPVFFASNEASPAKLDLERIPGIATRVKATPGAKLMLCPIATGGEWAAIFNGGQLPDEPPSPSAAQEEILLNLTARRGQNLTRLLMDEGLSPARITVCGPNVDMSKRGPSHATLAL